jgi:hypothetical protein
MAESITPIPLTASRAEQIFPTLSAPQIQRFAVHGQVRRVSATDVLVELGDKDIPVFVVISGELEVVRPPSHRRRYSGSLGRPTLPAKSIRFRAAVPSPMSGHARIQK